MMVPTIKNKNIKIIVKILLCLVVIFCFSSEAYAAPPEIKADAAILIDAVSGDILYGKNEYKLLPPASTTKVLTACLALSVADMDKVCTVSKAADKIGEATIYLSEGETLPMRDLLAAALICSANDSCFAIAENVAGSEQLFVQMMNVKARAMGAGVINACNTNGLPDEQHLFSAYALAKISREALQNPLFAELVNTEKMTIKSGRMSRTLKTTNKLLKMNEAVIGVKTGTTNAAGACLVSAMQRDGRTVIAVVLHSPDRYGESQRLLNYGIDEFENVCFAKDGDIAAVFEVSYGKSKKVSAVVKGNGITTVPKVMANEYSTEFISCGDVYAPVSSGEILGYMTFRDHNGGLVGQIPIVAKENVAKKQGISLIIEKIYNKLKD